MNEKEDNWVMMNEDGLFRAPGGGWTEDYADAEHFYPPYITKKCASQIFGDWDTDDDSE